MVFECLQYGTTRFMGMGTVGKAAIFRELEDFLEIAGEFFGLDIEGSKAFDTWGVDEPSTPHRNHFGEGGGVLTCVVGIRDLCGTEVHPWNELIDQR